MRRESDSPKNFGHSPFHLEIEPGRYLVPPKVGFSGYRDSRHQTVWETTTFYLVDAGFNNLARPILYGAYHPMSICRAGGGESDAMSSVVVGGPLCESGDIFTQEEGGFVCSRELPTASIGDFLIIECAGAYGAVMGSNYNSKPLAAEVMLKDGKAHLVRDRQTFEDLIRGERVVG